MESLPTPPYEGTCQGMTMTWLEREFPHGRGVGAGATTQLAQPLSPTTRGFSGGAPKHSGYQGRLRG